MTTSDEKQPEALHVPEPDRDLEGLLQMIKVALIHQEHLTGAGAVAKTTSPVAGNSHQEKQGPLVEHEEPYTHYRVTVPSERHSILCPLYREEK